MALDYKGIVLTGAVKTEAIGLGYVTTGTSFSDYGYCTPDSSVISISKSVVEDTTSLLTFTNIITELDTQFTAMGNQFDVTNTVEVYASLDDVSLNDGGKYSDDGAQYLCTYSLYVKVS